MSKEILKHIVNNDLDKAKSAVFQSLSEKASEAIQVRKQQVASQYFTPKAD